MTGFGQVHPLPGIWDSLHIDSAVTLPIGVEAYAAYALRACLSTSHSVSRAARRFAGWSAVASLLLGMAGQIAYHLLTQAGAARAPWGVTTAVSCLPVLVLGMGAALAHLLRADGPAGDQPPVRPGEADRTSASTGTGYERGLPGTGRPGAARAPGGDVARLTLARQAADDLAVAGQPVSRRRLRAAGLRGSNAELGTLARIVAAERASRHKAAALADPPPAAIPPPRHAAGHHAKHRMRGRADDATARSQEDAPNHRPRQQQAGQPGHRSAVRVSRPAGHDAHKDTENDTNGG